MHFDSEFIELDLSTAGELMKLLKSASKVAVTITTDGDLPESNSYAPKGSPYIGFINKGKTSARPSIQSKGSLPTE